MVQRRGIAANAIAELLDANGNPFPRPIPGEPNTVQLPTFNEQPQLVAYAEYDTEGGLVPMPHQVAFDTTPQVTVRSGYDYIAEVITGTWRTSSPVVGDRHLLTVQFTSATETNVQAVMIDDDEVWPPRPGASPSTDSKFLRRKLPAGLVAGATYDVDVFLTHSGAVAQNVAYETGIVMSVSVYETAAQA